MSVGRRISGHPEASPPSMSLTALLFVLKRQFTARAADRLGSVKAEHLWSRTGDITRLSYRT